MAAEEERSVERLVVFTDAVVAIAITLLVLPLPDLFSRGTTEADDHSADLLRVIGTHRGALFSFAPGFVLIARLWWADHRLLGPVQRWAGPLVCSTCSGPPPSCSSACRPRSCPRYDARPLASGICCGALLVSGAALTGTAALVRTSDAIPTARSAETRNRPIGSAVTAVAFALAPGVGLVRPHLTFFTCCSWG